MFDIHSWPEGQGSCGFEIKVESVGPFAAGGSQCPVTPYSGIFYVQVPAAQDFGGNFPLNLRFQ